MQLRRHICSALSFLDVIYLNLKHYLYDFYAFILYRHA